MSSFSPRRVFEDFNCMRRPGTIIIERILADPTAILANALAHVKEPAYTAAEVIAFRQWVMDHAIE
jgi:hypothetical protein